MRVLGHPLHMMLSHFPIGLLLTATVWDVLALFFPTLAPVARWTMIAGLATSIPAALAGMLDLAKLQPAGREDELQPAGREDELDPNDKIVRRLVDRHLWLVMSALVPFGLSAAMRGAGAPDPFLWIVAIDMVGCALLSAGAWHGGELVVRHGVGTMLEHNALGERRLRPNAPLQGPGPAFAPVCSQRQGCTEGEKL